jgi:hypothetical protein
MAALELAGRAWTTSSHGGLGERAQVLTPKTNMIAAGCGAVVALARAFAKRDNLELRSQVLLVSDRPAPRQLLGLACAMVRQAGPPKLLSSEPDLERLTKAAGELGMAQAHIVVLSKDASVEEHQSARALGKALGADNPVELGAA